MWQAVEGVGMNYKSCLSIPPYYSFQINLEPSGAAVERRAPAWRLMKRPGRSVSVRCAAGGGWGRARATKNLRHLGLDA